MNLLFTFDPHMHCIILHVVLKPEPAWWVDSRLELGRVKKTGEKKSGMTRRPGQKPGCNPLTLFLLK